MKISHRASIFAVGLLFSAAGTASASQTATHIYQAFKSNGQPAITVTHTFQGSCFSGSAAINRKDAWRCISGSAIADPCFSSNKAHGFVLCPAAPWKKSGFKLKLVSGLKGGNKHAPSTKGNPWGIQTSTGLKCSAATGATAAIGGHRANYACVKSNQWLWGSPVRSSQPWTILIAPLSAKSLKRHAKISVAWF
jgi:hypothetical protein